MSLEEALKAAEDELDHMREVQEARKAVLAAEEEAIHKQASLVNSLRVALSRYMGRDLGTLGPSGVDLSWVSMPRTRAVQRALEEIGRPVGPAEILRYLQSKGRSEDQSEVISATLAHLKRSGLVENQGWGAWVATAEEVHTPY